MEKFSLGLNKDPSNYSTDTFWSLVSFSVQIAAGAILNFSLFFIYGTEPLGVFNQLYAIFVISGQLFVFGLNDSVLKHSAEFIFDETEGVFLAVTALLLALFMGVIGGGLIALGALLVGSNFYSEAVQTGLFYMIPGTCLFVMNKVIFGLLNGRQLFKRFAFAQALRATVLVILVLYAVKMGLSLGLIGICFTITEVIVLFSQTGFLMKIHREFKGTKYSDRCFRRWGIAHLKFGSLSMPHGFLSESFIRIDILVLAFYLDDSAIGLYSFASFFVEGVYQLPVIIRNVTNPRLVHIFSERDLSALWKLVKRVGSLSFILTIIMAGCVLSGFSLATNYVEIFEYATLISLMQVIFFGLVIYAVFIPFDYVILQWGRPALQSLFMLVVVSTNIFFNVLLIPNFGLLGAAMGTSISMFMAGGFLCGIVYFSFDINSWSRNIQT